MLHMRRHGGLCGDRIGCGGRRLRGCQGSQLGAVRRRGIQQGCGGHLLRMDTERRGPFPHVDHRQVVGVVQGLVARTNGMYFGLGWQRKSQESITILHVSLNQNV